MEVGLTAKVSPEVDDRQVEREASKMQEYMDESVKGLEAAVDMADVSDKIEDTRETAQEVSETLTGASDSTGRLADNINRASMSAEQLEMSAEQTAFSGAMGMQGQDSPMGQAGAAIAAPGPFPEQTTQATSAVGPDMGQERGGGMGVDDSVKERLAQTAANTRSLTGMMSQLGNVFISQGGKVALAGLGLVFLSRMVSAVSNASPLLGQVLSILGLALQLFFRPIGNILGRLMMPIARRLLEMAILFNDLVNVVFEARSIHEGLEMLATTLLAGLASMVLDVRVRDLLRGAAAVMGGRALLKGIAARGGLMAIIRSRLPSIGAKRLISGLMARLPSLGLRAFATRLFARLPSIGLKRFLAWLATRLGLRTAGGGLAMAIPGIGQIIGALLALDLIVELLFGWSPIFDGIPMLLGKMAGFLKGIIDWFVSPFADHMPKIETIAAFLMLIYEWVGDKLGGFVDAGKSFFNDPVGALEGVLDGIEDYAGELGDWGAMKVDDLITGSINLWDRVKGGTRGIWHWVDDKSKDVWGWITTNSRSVWDWITTNSRGVWGWITTNSRSVWGWITTKGRSVWDWIETTGKDVWDWIETTGKDVWDWITTNTKELWQWINIPDIRLWDYVKIPEINLGQYINLPFSGGNDDSYTGPYQYEQPNDSSNIPEDSVWYGASGGIVSEATAAVIGEGSESEAVMPLSKLENFVSKPEQPGPTANPDIDVSIDVSSDQDQADVAETLSNELGSKLDNITRELQDLARDIANLETGEIKVTADGKVLAEVTEDGIDKYKRTREVNK